MVALPQFMSTGFASRLQTSSFFRVWSCCLFIHLNVLSPSITMDPCTFFRQELIPSSCLHKDFKRAAGFPSTTYIVHRCVWPSVPNGLARLRVVDGVKHWRVSTTAIFVQGAMRATKNALKDIARMCFRVCKALLFQIWSIGATALDGQLSTMTPTLFARKSGQITRLNGRWVISTETAALALPLKQTHTTTV